MRKDRGPKPPTHSLHRGSCGVSQAPPQTGGLHEAAAPPKLLFSPVLTIPASASSDTCTCVRFPLSKRSLASKRSTGFMP